MFCGIDESRLSYALEYDYEGGHGCDSDFSDTSEYDPCADMHRCATIGNIEVTDVSVSYLAGLIFASGTALKNRAGDGGITMYVIDRLLRAHNVYEPENWQVYTTSGYYGEEIGGATYEGDLARLENDLQTLAGLTDTAAICLALEREYGYQPDWADTLTIQRETLNVADINIPNPTQLAEAADGESYDILYGNQQDPRDRRRSLKIAVGLVRRTGKNRYTLIDGYHRWAHKAAEAPIDEIVMLVAS